MGGAYWGGGGVKIILGVCTFLWILLVVNLVTFMSFVYNSTNVDYFKEIYQFFWGVCWKYYVSFFLFFFWGGVVRQIRYLFGFWGLCICRV